MRSTTTSCLSAVRAMRASSFPAGQLPTPDPRQLSAVLRGQSTHHCSQHFGHDLRLRLVSGVSQMLARLSELQESDRCPFGNGGKDWELALFWWLGATIARAKRVPFSSVAMTGATLRAKYPEVHAQLREQAAEGRSHFTLRHANGSPFTAVVWQPLGDKAWPDVLCAIRTRGKGVEGKSNANGSTVSWNSGSARPGHLYVFLGRPGKNRRREICIFDGSDTGFHVRAQAIAAEEDAARDQRVLQRLAEEFPGGCLPDQPKVRLVLPKNRAVHVDHNRFLGLGRPMWVARAQALMGRFLNAALRPPSRVRVSHGGKRASSRTRSAMPSPRLKKTSSRV